MENEISIEEARKQFKERFQVIPNFPNRQGGQSVGNIPTTVHLVSLDLNIEIKVGFFRSQIRNKEFAQLLLELAVDELVK